MATDHRGNFVPDPHHTRVMQAQAAARKQTADLQRERALRKGQPDPATVDAVGIPEEFALDTPGRLPGQRFVNELSDDEMINLFGDLMR